ncbi:MAG: ferredoxin-thioredoxin reductase catalytic domain-containing protein [Methanomicrobiales archaeon]|nr:ferredoxin-thioredoxin reductase catalytic domain-containing protein [Methanomicrobiales archaeon]
MTEEAAPHVPCDPNLGPQEMEEAIRRWVGEYAARHGWRLNPDQKVLDVVIRGLTRNCRKFGKPYCPCRLRSGDPEKDREIECPCIFHRNEIGSDGHCHCNLFFSAPQAGEQG